MAGTVSVVFATPLPEGKRTDTIDINPELTSCSITTALPGGWESLQLGWADTPAGRRYRMERGVRVVPFGHVEVRIGGALVFAGRVMRRQRPGGEVRGCYAVGYGLSASTDHTFYSTDGVLTTSGAVLLRAMAAVAPLLRPGTQDQFIDPGNRHAPFEFNGKKLTQILQQLASEGGPGGVPWDYYVYEGQALQFVPRLPPATPQYHIPFDERVPTWDEDYTDVVSSVAVGYTSFETGASTVGLSQDDRVIVDRYGLARDALVPAGTLTDAASDQFGATYLAIHGDPVTQASVSRGPGDGVELYGGGVQPAYLVRAGESVQVGDQDTRIIVRTSYNVMTDTFTADLDSEPPRLQQILTTARQHIAQITAGINPNSGAPLAAGGSSGTGAIGPAGPAGPPGPAGPSGATTPNTGGLALPNVGDGQIPYRRLHTQSSGVFLAIGDSNLAGHGSVSGSGRLPEMLAAQLSSVLGLTITANNQAVGGTNSGTWTSAISGAIAAQPDALFCLVNACTNDTIAALGHSAAVVAANYLAMANLLADAGIIMVPIYPPYLGDTGDGFTGSSPALLASYLPAIRQLHNGDTVRVAGTTFYDTSRTNVSAYYQTDLFQLHLNATGITAWAAALADDLAPLVRSLTGSRVWDHISIGTGLSVVSSVLQATAAPFQLDHNGSVVGAYNTLNLIDGANITLTVANNPTHSRIDATFALATSPVPPLNTLPDVVIRDLHDGDSLVWVDVLSVWMNTTGLADAGANVVDGGVLVVASGVQVIEDPLPTPITDVGRTVVDAGRKVVV